MLEWLGRRGVRGDCTVLGNGFCEAACLRSGVADVWEFDEFASRLKLGALFFSDACAGVPLCMTRPMSSTCCREMMSETELNQLRSENLLKKWKLTGENANDATDICNTLNEVTICEQVSLQGFVDIGTTR